jgi:hypothetical protein
MQVYTCIFGGTKYIKKKLAKYTKIIYVETGKQREQMTSTGANSRKAGKSCRRVVPVERERAKIDPVYIYIYT